MIVSMHILYLKYHERKQEICMLGNVKYQVLKIIYDSLTPKSLHSVPLIPSIRDNFGEPLPPHPHQMLKPTGIQAFLQKMQLYLQIIFVYPLIYIKSSQGHLQCFKCCKRCVNSCYPVLRREQWQEKAACVCVLSTDAIIFLQAFSMQNP